MVKPSRINLFVVVKYFILYYNLMFQIQKCASLAAPLYGQPPVAAQHNMQSNLDRLNDTSDND